MLQDGRPSCARPSSGWRTDVALPACAAGSGLPTCVQGAMRCLGYGAQPDSIVDLHVMATRQGGAAAEAAGLRGLLAVCNIGTLSRLICLT